MVGTIPAQSVSDHQRQSWLASGMAVVWAIALAKLIFHIYFNNRYGYFRDEFNYIACGDHLQWGYVDQPPLIPFLIHVCRAVLGDSLRSIRFIPALASSLLVVQTAVLARELGGRRYAILLSAVCAVIVPQYLSNGSLLGTNCLEPNLWMGCAYFAILAIKRNDPRYWVWFGVVAGLGMEEKYSIAVFGLGIVVGLLLTEQRRAFFDKWIWLGGLAAFLIFLPNLLWNIHYDWPFVQLIHNIKADGRDVVLGPFEFFWQQILLVNPLTLPIWLRGLLFLLFSARLRPYRALGWCYLVCYAVFFVLHGKSYYLAPVYPMLLAAGAVVIESAIDGRAEGRADARPESGQRRLQWLKPVIAVVLIANGVYLAPIVVPVLSPDRFLAYAKSLPFKLPVMEHSHARAALPQWYSDQFGWQEIVDETAVAWNRLAPEERKDCGIFAQDYGQAGAIDFLGRRYGLPASLSGHQTWFLWGPRGYSGNCMIVLDDRREKLEQLWQQVDYVGTSAASQYALEQQIDVYICKGKKFDSLSGLWPHVKRWR
ncbi:MAG TPA: glycosyltransferase family 39 protein [Candidatus Sulfotelmatobacter sp.]|nr:glycosyltransferase family 39 protein [Candidatus Sulfotelmatobacter sp.]